MSFYFVFFCELSIKYLLIEWHDKSINEKLDWHTTEDPSLISEIPAFPLQNNVIQKWDILQNFKGRQLEGNTILYE